MEGPHISEVLKQCNDPEKFKELVNNLKPEVSFFGGRRYKLEGYKGGIGTNLLLLKYYVMWNDENIRDQALKDNKIFDDFSAITIKIQELEKEGREKESNFKVKGIFKNFIFKITRKSDNQNRKVDYRLYMQEVRLNNEKNKARSPERDWSGTQPLPSNQKIQRAFIILGVSDTASKKEVSKAYRQKALKLHPDRNKEDEEKMQELNDAKDTIKAVRPGYF